MKSAACLAAVIGLCVTMSARAETLYVIEQLVVNVTTSPDGAGDRVASIRSGDRVELIERQDDQAHVKLGSGAEGWVKSSYLSADPPLRQRLDERTEELEKTKRRVEQLENELEQAKLIAPPAPPPVAERPPEAAPPERSHTIFPDVNPSGRPTWKWVVGSSAVCLFLGFALGWRALDRKIRRKYGGLRIY
jgi:Bacterial SH3 domain